MVFHPAIEKLKQLYPIDQNKNKNKNKMIAENRSIRQARVEKSHETQLDCD